MTSRNWYSIYGTGAAIHGIDQSPEGHVEFTVWLSVFWLPLVPVSSWSTVYAGESPPDGITTEGHLSTDRTRIGHDAGCLTRTFVRGLLLGVVAVAPAMVMIARTEGRATTNAEMVAVFASTVWPVVLISLLEKDRGKSRRVRAVSATSFTRPGNGYPVKRNGGSSSSATGRSPSVAPMKAGRETHEILYRLREPG